MRKWMAMALAVSTAMATTVGTLPAMAREVPKDEMEKLKEELQKEIDGYSSEEYEWSASYSSGMGTLSLDAMTDGSVDGGIACEEAASQSVNAYAPMTDAWFVPDFDTEEYSRTRNVGFSKVSTDPLSTFAADVDTGSYCNLRRMARDGYLAYDVPSGAIRTEELLNYFEFGTDGEEVGSGRFTLRSETADSPWNDGTKLLLMTVMANGDDVEAGPNNFTFLLDTSGSMDEADKIALAKCAIKLVSYTLDPEDSVSIVTYSGDSYVVLDSARGDEYDKVKDALDGVLPYGGTNGSGGIEKAYELAEKNFAPDGNNRVFIMSDGDMNLGVTSQSGLADLIGEKRETGIFLTVLGFGTGNYSDANMEAIADAGNGNYYYVDCLDEAERVLVEKQKQTTVTAAKDVKFQAEFNPAEVSEYRLIGYENREVADDDFENDAVDGGEVGVGQKVTVLYEYAPADGTDGGKGLKYQKKADLTDEAASGEILTFSVNWKEPDGKESVTEELPVKESEGEATADMKLAMAVAETSMTLRKDPLAGTSSLEEAERLAAESASDGATDAVRRVEFAEIVGGLEKPSAELAVDGRAD